MKVVAFWIVNLPLADVKEIYHRVMSAPVKLAKGPSLCRKRFEVLEPFRRPDQNLIDGLKFHFVGYSFPLAT